ncbi:hypothetical protein Y032_0004g2201 [Ancylostoma ceylanicum]|uniref:Uncharacterized protein n=1 Tax=Ancylostoma ceylanicum TaxID=53326 RepID=A0A016VW62_9BILA|nr:hypothetical protein Y032_0004g2201 [Ancylostoma ceylanicum]
MAINRLRAIAAGRVLRRPNTVDRGVNTESGGELIRSLIRPRFSRTKMTVSSVENDLGVAILMKNEAMVKSMIYDGVDVDRSDTVGSPPLHYAAFIGDITLTQMLLENGANPDVEDSLGLTPLHRAVAAMHYDVAELLIDRGCDTGIQCKSLQTPLHICAIHNAPSIAELLLRKHYPMLDSADSRGCTALHHAAYHGHVEVAEHLLKAGINMAANDKLGRTAVHSMACGGSVEMLAVLREAGAKITVQDFRGRTAAHYAAMASQTELLSALLEIDGRFLNATDKDGYTPLHYAVQNGQNAKTIEFLVKKGCDILAAANDGTTALHIAATLAESAVPIEYLVECKGIDLNTRNGDGMTPLHLASEWSKVSRVDALIKAGAEVDARSHDDATPLHCAAIGGHQLVVKHLLKFNADVNARMKDDLTPLHLAAYNSCRTVVQTLVEMGADKEAKDSCSRTPLLLASGSIASNGAFTVEYLVKNKAAVNIADNQGLTPLHWAAAKGLERTVGFLLKGGADVDRPDNRGRNALHMAVLSRSRITQGLLCEANPKATDRKDCNGFYPLHYAAFKGDEKLCTYLLKSMEDVVEMPTSDVYRAITPLHLAAMRNMSKPLLPLAEAVKKKATVAHKLARNRTSVDRPMFADMDAKNRIPLHYAMKYGNYEPTKVLLSQPGAELCLTWRDKDEMTPLHFAAANGKNTCIEWVLRNFSKISVNRRDSKGRSAGMLSLTSLSGPYWPLIQKSNLERCDNMGRGYLHRAVYSRCEDALMRVLQKCNPNTKDVNGVTPLHVAAAVGWREAVAILLGRGAALFATDNRGFTPLDWAAAYNRLDVMGELLASSRRSSPDSALGSGGTTSSPLDTSGEALSGESTATAVEADKPVNESEPCGRAGLLFAAYLGHLSSVMFLLEHEPHLISARDPRGRTALHLAAWRGSYDCVDYLVKRGIPVEAVDDNGATALMYAVKDPKSIHVVEYLLNHGVDLSKKDYNGNTVLHHCCLSKNEESGKILTSYLDKFDPQRVICNATNENGETAVHIAVRHGLIEFLLLFIPYGSKSISIRDAQGRIPLMCGIEDPDIIDCMRLVLACMMDTPAAEMSGLFLNDRRQSPVFDLLWKIGQYVGFSLSKKVLKES